VTKQIPTMTVNGPVDVESLGRVLMHEHMVFDFSMMRAEPETEEEASYFDRPLSMELVSFLRFHPFLVRDNMVNTDEDLVVEELGYVTRVGGGTIVDPTNRSIGRDPLALRRIAERTGLNIVMGAGYYTQKALDEEFDTAHPEIIAAEIIRDVTIGVGETGIRSGIIGEVGTSAPITLAEELSLRGAAMAQAETGAPLMVHIDGWGREGHRVLDIVESEGGDAARTVLCHMNPSWEDEGYQAGLIERGAFIEYDMLGNNQVYPEPMGPSPDEIVCIGAIAKHLRAGRGSQILLSQDVFLKMMFRRFGGHGYAHIMANLGRMFTDAGITPDDLDSMLIDNTRRILANEQIMSMDR